MSTLLKVTDLQNPLSGTRAGLVRSVDGVSFEIKQGEARWGWWASRAAANRSRRFSIMRLISPPGKIAGGSIKFKGEELTTVGEERLRAIRGNDIAMIFQDPMNAAQPGLYGRRTDRRGSSAPPQTR